MQDFATPELPKHSDMVEDTSSSSNSETRPSIIAEDENSELKAEISRLHALHRAKDEFLSFMAHELRNPIAPLSNSLQILARLKDLNPALAGIRTIMERQVDQLKNLADDLSDASRLSTLRFQLHVELSCLNKLLQEAISVCRSRLEPQQLKISSNLIEESVTVKVDSAKLVKCLSSLILRAAKCSPVNEPVTVTSRTADNHAEISIQNFGAGVSTESLSNFFDFSPSSASSTTEPEQQFRLKLAVAKQLVAMHGGQIEAKSDGIGKGTTIVIRLPLAEAPATTERVPAKIMENQTYELSAGPVFPRRILIVDDSPSGAFVLSELLQQLGQSVETADSAPAALAKAHQFRPDMVISDINMPGIDGYELARRIKCEPQFEGVTLVAMTGYDDDHHREKSKAAGFDLHLVKPVSLNALEVLLNSTTPATV